MLEFLKPKPKTVNDDEKMMLDIVQKLLIKERTFITVLDGASYVSNYEIGQHIIVYADYISISSETNGNYARIRQDFSKLLLENILEVLREKIEKIKEVSKNNETSIMTSVLNKIETAR